MKSLKIYSRIFYGTGIAGIGILHFIYPGFRPVILPLPPDSTQHVTFLIYLTGAFFLVAGLMIAVGKNTSNIALYLGAVLLLFLIFGHLPNRLMNMPTLLGAWTDALKLLALSGGAFIVARSFPDGSMWAMTGFLNRIAPYGKYFFALMLTIFGIDHFIYTDFVKTLVPDWIPGHLFWTYFSGVALIGAGLAIFINFKHRTVMLLLGVMLFLWLILVHIPRAFMMDTGDGNEIISVLECLAFSGVAFLLYTEK